MLANPLFDGKIGIQKQNTNKRGNEQMTIELLSKEYQIDVEQIEQVMADGFTLEEIEEMLIASEL